MEFIRNNLIEIFTFCVTLIIARQNIKANKEIVVLKSNIEALQKKKSIEYEEIQTYKVQRISNFINKFSEYVVSGAIEKLEGKKDENKESGKSNNNIDLRKEFQDLINTLILFCDDETFIEYRKFQVTLLNLVDEYKELRNFINNIPKEVKEGISSGKLPLKKENFEKSNRLIEINKEINNQYGQLVIALRKSIGIETNINPEEYMKVYLQLKD